MIDQVPKKEFSGTWDQPKIGLRFKEFPSFLAFAIFIGIFDVIFQHFLSKVQSIKEITTAFEFRKKIFPGCAFFGDDKKAANLNSPAHIFFLL